MERTPAHVWRGAPAAVAFLTRIPVPARLHSADVATAAPWMPVVGLGIGAGLAGVWMAFAPFGAVIRALATLTASILLTGALHEDGLGDAADALGGGTTRERVFEILKDSRIGAFGAIAIALSLAWRLALLVAVGGRAPLALVASHSISRLAPVWLMTTLPYVSPLATAKTRLPAKVPVAWAATATLFVAVAVLTAAIYSGVPWRRIAAAFSGSVIATSAMGWYFNRRVGGITGDLLGAAEQVVETVVLLACV